MCREDSEYFLKVCRDTEIELPQAFDMVSSGSEISKEVQTGLFKEMKGKMGSTRRIRN